MGVIGIEEIFLDVKDLTKAVDFYHNLLGIPVARRDDQRAYLQCEQSHVVLQVKGHSGRHRGGGPMHFAFTVTEVPHSRRLRLRPWPGPARRPWNNRPGSLTLPGTFVPCKIPSTRSPGE